VEQRLGLRQDAEFPWTDEALHRDRAQVDDLETGVLVEEVGRLGFETMGDHGPALEGAEKHLRVGPRGAVEIGTSKERGRPLVRAAQDWHIPGDGDRCGPGVARVARQDVVIPLGAVTQERIGHKAETVIGEHGGGYRPEPGRLKPPRRATVRTLAPFAKLALRDPR
jgi:hypothetical protein